MGFLAEDRRINVAVTRARRHVAIICDSRTVGSQAFLGRLLEHFRQHGQVRTAFEYLDDLVPENYSHGGERQQSTKAPAAPSPKPQPAPGRKPKAAAKAAAKAAPQKQEARCSPSASRPGGESPGTKGDTNKFKAVLEAFLEGDEPQLDFPSSLSPHDRMLIHLLAEEHGLQHVSTGEGRDRYISVRKKELGQAVVAPAATQREQHPPPQPQDSSKEAPAPAEPGGRSEGSGKVDLKRLHLERVQREKARREEMAKKEQESSTGTRGNSSRKKDKSECKGRSLTS